MLVLSIEKGPKERRVMMFESKREAESGSKIRYDFGDSQNEENYVNWHLVVAISGL